MCPRPLTHGGGLIITTASSIIPLHTLVCLGAPFDNMWASLPGDPLHLVCAIKNISNTHSDLLFSHTLLEGDEHMFSVHTSCGGPHLYTLKFDNFLDIIAIYSTFPLGTH